MAKINASSYDLSLLGLSVIPKAIHDQWYAGEILSGA